MAEPDPYYLAEQTIQSSVRGLVVLHEQWKKLLISHNTYTSKDYKWAYKELIKLINALTDDINDVNDSIDVVEKFPSKFNLTGNEIEQRKIFVRGVKAKLDEVQSDLNDPMCKRKIEDDKSKELLSSEKKNMVQYNSRHDALRRAHEEDNNDFLRDQHGAHQMLLNKQDEHLDDLIGDVKILGDMSKNMKNEIELQAGILDRLTYRVEQSSATMASVMRKLDRFMTSTKSTTQWIIIAVLGIIFIILVVLSSTILKKR
ncbi:putative syntaxin 10 [Tieghemostelium lacteum]|uniref:Putative syntaxin 10 n=1 Tax=Tieghemostelium lacteum TaxID=361077 RepID=A0A151ZSV9_TIELA|nr:putative syntaxin 10 [Tieghemostelium lacteum]|eukprot:KYQ96864.1 putative syntaxin 10 [Tieghemostelium lacteum]